MSDRRNPNFIDSKIIAQRNCQPLTPEEIACFREHLTPDGFEVKESTNHLVIFTGCASLGAETQQWECAYILKEGGQWEWYIASQRWWDLFLVFDDDHRHDLLVRLIQDALDDLTTNKKNDSMWNGNKNGGWVILADREVSQTRFVVEFEGRIIKTPAGRVRRFRTETAAKMWVDKLISD